MGGAGRGGGAGSRMGRGPGRGKIHIGKENMYLPKRGVESKEKEQEIL